MSEIHSFSDINDYIKSKIGHGDVCLSNRFSFIKIFQHALSYYQTKNLSKISKNYLGLPLPVQYGIYWIKSFRKRNAVIKINEIVTLETNRTILDHKGRSRSVYFDRICDLIEKPRLTRLATVSTTSFFDYNLQKLNFTFPYPDRNEKEMIHDVLFVLNKAKRSGIFNGHELTYIQSALAIFLEEFRFYYNLFKNQPTRKIIFTCHYHKEGLIAAARVLGIDSIELQHGLIAQNDIYYVYPHHYIKCLKNAFFPDHLFVFGSKWKEILSKGFELDQNQISNVGDYSFRPDLSTAHNSQKQNLILITSQKGIHEDYIGYCHILEKFIKLHPGWEVIVKLHPFELNRKEYEQQLTYPFHIASKEEILDNLFQCAKIHISIYSTTLYDAIGFGLVNFSVQNFGKSQDYARDIVADGIAIPIEIYEDPIERYEILHASGQHETLCREDFYPPMNQELIKDVLGRKTLTK